MILILVFASAAAVLINAVAFAANAGVLWVVLRNRTLKKAPTSVFLVNLCAADLAVAVIVIPVATVVLILWSFDDDGAVIPTSLCGSLSFFHSLLVNAGVWAAAAISVDRRFSIVSPMAHAAFMTSRRALVGVAAVWATAILFAVIPHLYTNHSSSLLFNYTESTSVETSISFVSSALPPPPPATGGDRWPLRLNASSALRLIFNSSTSVSTVKRDSSECHLWKTCALMFSLDWSDSGQVFAVLIGCYLIPACIMVSMYLSIFRVARKCGLQVCPVSVRPCNSAISTVSEEVEIREECERGAGREEGGGGEDSIAKEGNPNAAEGADGSRLFRADLAEDTLDRIGVQIGDRKPSGGTEKAEPESTRHCIFQHLFPEDEDRGAAVVEGPFCGVATRDPTERTSLGKPPGALRSPSRRWRRTESQKSARRSVSRVASCTSTVAGVKARRTLLLILGLSLGSWTPYYLLHAYCASTDDCWMPITSCPPWGYKAADRMFWKTGHRRQPPCDVPCTSDSFPVSFLVYQRSVAALVVAWLLFLSSAFNPILYGLMNRPVREQILLRASSATAALSHARRYLRRLCGGGGGGSGVAGPARVAVEPEGGEEDFMQFLERTSSLSECLGPSRLPGSPAGLSSQPRPPAGPGEGGERE